MARDDILNAHGKLQLMQGPDEDRNYNENERMKLRTRSSSGSKPGSDEQIHSGHFMVSDPHRGKKKDRVGFDFVSANKDPTTSYSFGENQQCSGKEIESSFTKLFECLSLAYNGGTIVSPKWKWFRGLKLSTKDKIRLNNAIWREWHMQFRSGRAPVICQFGSPLAETNHKLPEAVVLEGKYWKRTPSTVVSEYNKWRIFMMQQKKLAASGGKIKSDLNHADLKFDVHKEEPMVFEDSFFTDFHDTLFSSLNQPFAFPNPKELAHMNNADMIQPGLVQLQPTLESSFDDFMDTLEPFQVDLTRSLTQSNTPFIFTGCDTNQQNIQGALMQQRRFETQSLQLPINAHQSSMQPNQGLDSATEFLNSQMLTNSSPMLSNNNQMLSDNSQMLSNSAHMLGNSSQMLSDNPQIMSDNTQMLSDNSQMLRNSSQILGNSSQMLSDNPQIMSDNTQMLSDNSQMLRNSSQMLDNNSQMLSDNSQVMSDNTQMLSDNTQMLSDNTQMLSDNTQSVNASLYGNVQVNDLGQFQGPYPVQITEALNNTSKDEFTASLVEQFRQDKAQLDQLAERQKMETAVQNVTQLLSQQQNVTLLNPVAEPMLTLPGQQTIRTVNPSRTLVSLKHPGTPQSMHNQQTILSNSAVQILQQAANHAAADQKPVITNFMKPPILQPQQAAQQVQFSQPTTSIVLPAVSTHQVLLPLSVKQPTMRAVQRDVFVIPKCKAPTRRIAPAPPPPTSNSVSNVSTTALLSQLLTKDKKATNFAIAPSTAVLVPTLLKSDLSTNSTCVISNTTPIFEIATSTMSAGGLPVTLNNSPVSTTTINSLSIMPDSCSEAHSSRDDDDKKTSTHISAEAKRRFNIKSGFDMLHVLIPSISQNPNSKISKASMLQKSVDYTKKLQQERAQYEKEIALLKQEVAVLNISINETQAQLPASGVPVTRQRFDQMQGMFDDYVRERTKHNWKFWIFSIIIRPLFESFNTVVSTSSKEELLRTVLSWLDQHCSLLALRPTVLSSLTLLSRTTSILSNPEQMPQQAAKAVNKDQ